jgi:hypothetical protein
MGIFLLPVRFAISRSACLRSPQSADLMAGSPVSHEREGLFDAVMIPRMIKVLSERFDQAGRLLLFCESAKLRLHAPADGLNCRIWRKIHWTSKIISVRAPLRGRCSVCP